MTEYLAWIRFGACALLLTGGICVCAIGIFGTFRMKYVLNRMHAAALSDTLGLLLGTLGLCIAAGFGITSLKMLLAVLILWCTSPVSSHLIARLVVLTQDRLEEHMTILNDAAKALRLADLALSIDENEKKDEHHTEEMLAEHREAEK